MICGPLATGEGAAAACAMERALAALAPGAGDVSVRAPTAGAAAVGTSREPAVTGAAALGTAEALGAPEAGPTRASVGMTPTGVAPGDVAEAMRVAVVPVGGGTRLQPTIAVAASATVTRARFRLTEPQTRAVPADRFPATSRNVAGRSPFQNSS
ncbi:MAG: hypothetical protein NVS1B2_25950 [Vulcanimicrobiaceae bacterium]